ncbi:hypothetical protein H0H93_008937 [Arthromyces matolae]|nr:hypothetical protein H0H93_008937 [Arthromyces matolae]
MKFTSILATLIVLPAIALGTQTTTTYDPTYDNASGSLNSVACSNGKNGLVTAGYKTFGSLPAFPYIGGASAVAGWNSTNCGTCWKLTYVNPKGASKSIFVLAVDHAGTGFNIGLKAMNELTNNKAIALGRADITATEVAKSKCGISSLTLSTYVPKMSSASSSSSRVRDTRKRRRDTLPHSSDTEAAPVTPPPRKRARRQRADLVQIPDCDLEELLRRRVFDVLDVRAIEDLKNMKRLRRDQDVLYVARDIIDKVKTTVKAEIHKKARKTLEVELYLKWLQGLEFVVNGIEAVLDAKIPGTQRRVTGVGRVSFSLLYHLMDIFIDEVNAHQDGWSFRYPAGPVEPDPFIMTLMEECNDPISDTRSEEAVRAAEEFFERYDKVMVSALRRYKSECNKKLTAPAISRKEESLSRGCCLLSEQTGYGGTDDMGFNLLVKTRDAMIEWKSESEEVSSCPSSPSL